MCGLSQFNDNDLLNTEEASRVGGTCYNETKAYIAIGSCDGRNGS